MFAGRKCKSGKVQRPRFPMPDILGYVQAFLVSFVLFLGWQPSAPVKALTPKALTFNQPYLILTSNTQLFFPPLYAEWITQTPSCQIQWSYFYNVECFIIIINAFGQFLNWKCTCILSNHHIILYQIVIFSIVTPLLTEHDFWDYFRSHIYKMFFTAYVISTCFNWGFLKGIFRNLYLEMLSHIHKDL